MTKIYHQNGRGIIGHYTHEWVDPFMLRLISVTKISRNWKGLPLVIGWASVELDRGRGSFEFSLG